MNKKMKIGIIMGGISTERGVSLKTGAAMVKILKANPDYEIVEFVINEKNDILNIKDIDFALIALHGKCGEDGMVQNYCEIMDIPYSGCNPLASAVCMDKNMTKSILKAHNIPTADWVTIKELNENELEKAYDLNYPVFVKPNSGGSSVATFMIKTKEELIPAVKEALKYDKEVMVEEFIKGEEITCAMLDGKMMPVIKIDSKGEFFDFESKYNQGGADEYAVTLEGKLKNNIEKSCTDTWNALGCEVYGRIDFIINDEGFYVLEVNTLPGMTPTSLFPKSAEAHGIKMYELIDKVIELSLKCRKK